MEAEKCKLCEIYRRMCDMYREIWISLKRKKMFTNGLNMALPLWAWVKKTVHRMETHWLIGKEKLLCTGVNKEGYVNGVVGQEKTHYWKGATISNVLYYQLLWQNSPYLLNAPCVCVCVCVYIYIYIYIYISKKSV